MKRSAMQKALRILLVVPPLGRHGAANISDGLKAGLRSMRGFVSIFTPLGWKTWKGETKQPMNQSLGLRAPSPYFVFGAAALALALASMAAWSSGMCSCTFCWPSAAPLAMSWGIFWRDFLPSGVS